METNVYRYILSNLADAESRCRESKENIKILMSALVVMAEVCDMLSDVRTAVLLRDKASEIEKGNGGGLL